MNRRADLVRVKIIPRGDTISSHSPVPLLSLEAAARAAGSPTSTEYGIEACVIDIGEATILSSSLFHTPDIDPRLRKRRRLILEDAHPDCHPNQRRFNLNCYGDYATNLNEADIYRNDHLIITMPYVCPARKSNDGIQQFEIYVGCKVNNRSEIIICRKDRSHTPNRGSKPPMVSSNVSPASSTNAFREIQNLSQRSSVKSPHSVSRAAANRVPNTSVRVNQNVGTSFSPPRHINPQVIYTEIQKCDNLFARYNTWAVVTRIARAPSITNGFNYMAILYIQDETYEGSYGFQDFQFNILGPKISDFPPMAVGDIIRIKTMKIEQYNGFNTGKVFYPQAIALFQGETGDPIKPITTSKNFELTDAEYERVEELRRWKAQQGQMQLDSQYDKSICEVDHPMTFDLVCQVISVLQSEADSSHQKVLRVADGTKSPLSLLALAEPDDGTADTDGSLINLDCRNNRSEVDIFIEGNPFDFSEALSGKIIRLIGVRCTKEIYEDSIHRIRNVPYRFILPDDSTVGFQVLPQNHGHAKQIERQVAVAKLHQNTEPMLDPEIEDILANAASPDVEGSEIPRPQNAFQGSVDINQTDEGQVKASKSNRNTKKLSHDSEQNKRSAEMSLDVDLAPMARTQNPFPDSQEFNQLMQSFRTPTVASEKANNSIQHPSEASTSRHQQAQTLTCQQQQASTSGYKPAHPLTCQQQASTSRHQQAHPLTSQEQASTSGYKPAHLLTCQQQASTSGHKQAQTLTCQQQQASTSRHEQSQTSSGQQPQASTSVSERGHTSTLQPSETSAHKQTSTTTRQQQQQQSQVQTSSREPAITLMRQESEVRKHVQTQPRRQSSKPSSPRAARGTKSHKTTAANTIGSVRAVENSDISLDSAKFEAALNILQRSLNTGNSKTGESSESSTSDSIEPVGLAHGESQMPVVAIYDANGEEFVIETDSEMTDSQPSVYTSQRSKYDSQTSQRDAQSSHSNVLSSHSDAQPSQAESTLSSLFSQESQFVLHGYQQYSVKHAGGSDLFSSQATQSSQYFTCNEESQEIDESRLSPSPEPSTCGMTTSANYPWISMEEMKEAKNLDRFRFKCYVSELLPYGVSEEPLNMVVAMCLEGCDVISKMPVFARSPYEIRCKLCSKPMDIIFSLALEVTESEITNFATQRKQIQIVCSGKNAEELFGCKAPEFVASKKIQDETVQKWLELEEKQISFAFQVAKDGDDVEYHLIQSRFT